MIRAEVEELGRMLGLPVLKPPPGAPRGVAFMLGDEFYVRDEWPGELSRMVAEARRLARGFLTGRIRLAEQRLGLEPCPHSRTTGAQRNAVLYGWEVVCLVCAERIGWLSDEAMCRSFDLAGVSS